MNRFKNLEELLSRYKEINDYFFDGESDLNKLKDSIEKDIKFRHWTNYQYSVIIENLFSFIKNKYSFVTYVQDYEHEVFDYLDFPFLDNFVLSVLPSLQYIKNYRKSSHSNDKEMLTVKYIFNNNGILNS